MKWAKAKTVSWVGTDTLMCQKIFAETRIKWKDISAARAKHIMLNYLRPFVGFGGLYLVGAVFPSSFCMYKI